METQITKPKKISSINRLLKRNKEWILKENKSLQWLFLAT